MSDMQDATLESNEDQGTSIEDVANLLGTTGETAEAERDEEAINAEGDEGQSEPQTDETEEVEFEGKTYKVPKELKGALLRESDYTKKTMQVAEQRKEVEERAQLLAQRETALNAAFDKAVEFRDIQNQLSQYEQLDWQTLVDADPVQATKLNLAYQKLQREAAQKYNELQNAQATHQKLMQEERAKVIAREQSRLKAILPNFNDDLAKKISASALEYGITEDELKSVIDSRYVHILHDAMRWKALQAEKGAAIKKVTSAPKAITPQAAKSKQSNQAALDRLRKTGRIEDLAALL